MIGGLGLHSGEGVFKVKLDPAEPTFSGFCHPFLGGISPNVQATCNTRAHLGILLLILEKSCMTLIYYSTIISKVYDT